MSRGSEVNRRAFLASFLATSAAALVLDPERALWVPGRKLISIPKPAPGPLWLSIRYLVPADRALVLALADSLIDEWKLRESRDGVTYTPEELHDPRSVLRSECSVLRSEIITTGRFPVRVVEAFDCIRGRMIGRLDLSNAEAAELWRGGVVLALREVLQEAA